jgi:hypothetical protein
MVELTKVLCRKKAEQYGQIGQAFWKARSSNDEKDKLENKKILMGVR